MAGITEIPCIVTEGEPDDASLLADRLIENVCRSGLKPLELARGISLLRRLRKCTSQDAAAELGLSGATVCRAMSLLNLPEDVQQMVDEGRVAESIAYSISRLDSEDDMREVANTVARCRLNRDQALELCQQKGVEKKKTQPRGDRLSGKAEGVTYSIGGPLTAEGLSRVIEILKGTLKELKQGEPKGIADPAEPLKAS
jgi:ParB family chromosome partitioning protein